MREQRSFREYGHDVMRLYLHNMLSHIVGVRAGEDTEAIHDIRVASRRLRSAIGVFGVVFPGPEFASFEREVKQVTSAFSEARDLDVMLNAVTKMRDTLPAAKQAGVEAFIEQLRERRARMQREVVRALDRVERQNLEARLEAMAYPGSHRPRVQAGIASDESDQSSVIGDQSSGIHDQSLPATDNTDR